MRQPRSPDAHRDAQAFVESKSLDNTVAPMIKFRLDELEHFVFMMFLYGTDGIAEYTQNSPVFKGLQKSRIKRLQTAVLSVSSTQALQKLKGLNMFRFAVYHYVELQRLVQRGQVGGTKDSRVVNSYPMHDKGLQQMEIAKIEKLFSDPPAEKLVFEAMAKRSLLSTQNLVRSVPVRIKLLPTNEALQYLDELAEQINRKMWERKLQKE